MDREFESLTLAAVVGDGRARRVTNLARLLPDGRWERSQVLRPSWNRKRAAAFAGTPHMLESTMPRELVPSRWACCCGPHR